jgi:hypothetical protein
MRVIQPAGTRGSQKWIQRAINKHPNVFDPLILAEVPCAEHIEWLSPLEHDEHAEYRDNSFLNRIGCPELAPALVAFWPVRGPQWDALARTNNGDVLLVEAKAHIDEMFSSGTQASPDSRTVIESALTNTASALGAKPLSPWTGPLYQTANRIAFLQFLIDHQVAARLVFVCFVGDTDVGGPPSADEWRGALHVTRRMLGLPKRHPLHSRIVHVFAPVGPYA